MSLVTIGVDKIIDQQVIAVQSVKGYSGDFTTVRYTFAPGQTIGNVYSYVQDNNGNEWLMFYVNDNDYNNFLPTYVKADASSLSVPALPDILQKIAAQDEADQIAQKGVIRYYIEKYLPYIIGAAVVAIAFPAITKSIKNEAK